MKLKPETPIYAKLQIKHLEVGAAPEAYFQMCCEQEKVEAVYEYCNLHSLWKA